MLYPNPTITGFGDALVVALSLFRQFGEASGAVLLDDHGDVTDTAICDEGHPIECLVEWAEAAILRDDETVSVLLVSASPSLQPCDLREADIDRFRHARERCEDAGAELRDWLITDGDDIRSMAFSCLLDAGWSDQSQ